MDRTFTQSLRLKPLSWIYRVDLERGALGNVGRDRIASPDNGLPLQHAFGCLADAGARRRGEALPLITLVEGKGFALSIATSPTITRVLLEVNSAWIGEQLEQSPTRIWQHATSRLVVVEADANGTIHPMWRRLQRLDWADCESQEVAA